MKVILVSCGKKKATSTCLARDMYTSTLSKEAKIYASSAGDLWYILSAKHGLLAPNEIISPYDETLKQKNRDERDKWANLVVHQLKNIPCSDMIAEIEILGGEDYYNPLAAKLLASGFNVTMPLGKLPLGKRIPALRNLSSSIPRDRHVDRFYRILDELYVGLSGGRFLGECNGRLEWPERGVYFFFESTETRRGQPRVVRIGTHAVSKGSKTSLWNRLSTHRGTEQGFGNHRSSIFRSHIGEAMIERGDFPRSNVPTWGKGQSAPKETLVKERELETCVSAYLKKMRLLWLNVPDEPGPDSDRAYIEQNLIALLTPSGHAVDSPSSCWLGLFNPNEVIRLSGLWNLNHVGENFDPFSLDVFSAYVQFSIASHDTLKFSLAPSGWRKSRKDGAQLSLF